jgi:cytochrome c oxidase subunit 3
MSHHADVAPDILRLQTNTGIPSSKLGMWLFLASDAMGFVGLLGTYIVLRFSSTDWPVATEVLDIPLVSLNTFILICSSVTMVKGLAALQDGNRKWYRIHIFLTAMLGLAFVAIQGVEWYYMIYGHGGDHGAHAVQVASVDGHGGAAHSHGATAKPDALPTFKAHESLFGASFYALTGYHGFHVLVGVVYLLTHLVISMLTERNGRTWVDAQDNTIPTEIMGLYWHFVDLVWIILFTVIYLM